MRGGGTCGGDKQLISDTRGGHYIDTGCVLVGRDNASCTTGEYGEEEGSIDTLGETCNEACFRRHLQRLMKGEASPPPALAHLKGAPVCAHEDLYAHAMYASVCAFVLSDEAHHRRLRYLDAGRRQARDQAHRGMGGSL